MDKTEFPNNLTIDYNGYVHFAYNVGKYLIQKCPDEVCSQDAILEWYTSHFRNLCKAHFVNPTKGRVTFEYLMNNLINDECLLVVSEEDGKRIVKRHPEFFIWAWKNVAKTFEHVKRF
ncbi:hypothetical protein BdWA1_001153 [Babesia duncani]|uniref:Mcm6 C-terminal winged-helix domain-containing protein n=1 Tax=Babesia duncani TaxID=323732 RepID=A0AAD9UQR6_9APIC|nr:hypothetical protein BdWA1_001153 [Babesia duncani]